MTLSGISETPGQKRSKQRSFDAGTQRSAARPWTAVERPAATRLQRPQWRLCATVGQVHWQDAWPHTQRSLSHPQSWQQPWSRLTDGRRVLEGSAHGLSPRRARRLSHERFGKGCLVLHCLYSLLSSSYHGAIPE